jgi:predicted AlkP superfamily pyrophosphatase or phosphodiesterase
LIAVDQFRYDYIERFGDLFVENGIKRLMREGASWVNANYDHTPTYTGPGHATMMTGAWPSETGIIANDWPDRESGRVVNCVSDSNVKLLGGEGTEAGSSPRRLMVSTLGDELRLATNDRSKVIGISLKDRSAILPGGRRANAAYWFSGRSGNMVSSDYYFRELPAWVTKFNASRPVDKFFGAKWDRLLPEAEYLKRAGVDAAPWEKVPARINDTNAFPHVITGGAKTPGRQFYDELDTTPFANELLLEFTEQALDSEGLGEDQDTDVLSISFSANDYVGHRFGPYSHEVMDVSLRVDRQIASLLDFVNKRVGLRNTAVIFTADHGVAPFLEQSNAIGLDGLLVQNTEILRVIRTAIRERFGKKGETSDTTADYIQRFAERDGFRNGQLYFNRAALKRDGIDPAEAERVAGEAGMTVVGISRYFTRTQLERGAIPPGDQIARRILHGFYPRRSGDVLFVHDAFKQFGDPDPHHHGSPYSYDTHVPLIIMGSGMRPGRYFEAASPADIAPTLAALLGVQSPSNATGRILIEAMVTPKPR